MHVHVDDAQVCRFAPRSIAVGAADSDEPAAWWVTCPAMRPSLQINNLGDEGAKALAGGLAFCPLLESLQ